VLWLVPGLAFTKYRCEFVTLFCIYAVFRIGTVVWPMSAHASQVFSIAHYTDSEDLPLIAVDFHNTTQFTCLPNLSKKFN